MQSSIESNQEMCYPISIISFGGITLSILGALTGVFTIFVLIAVGFYITKRGFLDNKTVDRLTTLTVRFSIPFLLFKNAINNFSREFVAEQGLLLLIPILPVVLSFIFAKLLAKLIKTDEKRSGVFVVTFTLANVTFIGLPVVLSIFGDIGAVYDSVYLLWNTLLFWSFGCAGIAKSGGQTMKFGWGAIKRVFSPPLIGFLSGFTLSMLGIKLPDFIMNPINYLGNLTTPLSMLLTGAVISGMGKKAFHLPKEGWLTLLGRFIIAPGLTLATCLILGANEMMTCILTVVSAMPSMTQCMIMSKYYNADYEFAAQMLTVTTICSMIIIPVIVTVLTLIY